MLYLNNYPQVISNHTNKNPLGNYVKTSIMDSSYVANASNSIFVAGKNRSSLMNPRIILKKKMGFLLEILFCGFNYNNKRISHLRKDYTTDVHKAEVFTIREPYNKKYKSRIYKRRLVFFSYDNALLQSIAHTIKGFRLPNLYTGKGLYSPGDIYKVKKMRKRK